MLDGGVAFRDEDVGCYVHWNSAKTECFALNGKDPLFSPDLSPMDVSADVLKAYSDVVSANLGLIAFNGIMKAP